MNEELKTDQVKLRIHGGEDTAERVRASVFARQLGSLVKALEAIDQVSNGGRRFDYVIQELQNESASAILSQVVASKKPRRHSPMFELGEAISGIVKLDRAVLERYADCVPHIEKLAVGVSKEFSHTDLRINGHNSFRIDDFFQKQVVRAKKLAVPIADRRYRGFAIGSFQGIIKVADLRGDTPRLKLILSAGGKEIDCVCSGMADDKIREVLNRRVSIDGRAYYSGEGGLPDRVEILNVKLLKEQPDMLRWQGSFEGLKAEDWDEYN